MKPTHPVELLACAIATKEGFFLAGTIPAIRNNPGDLNYAGQLGANRAPAGAPDPNIAIFDSLGLGIAGLFRQLWVLVAMRMTIRQIVSQWAPGDATYLPDVLEWTGLPADTPILELLPPLVQLNLET